MEVYRCSLCYFVLFCITVGIYDSSPRQARAVRPELSLSRHRSNPYRVDDFDYVEMNFQKNPNIQPKALPYLQDIFLPRAATAFQKFLNANPTFSEGGRTATEIALTLQSKSLYYVWTTYENFMLFDLRDFKQLQTETSFFAPILDINTYANYVDFAIGRFSPSNAPRREIEAKNVDISKGRISLKLLRQVEDGLTPLAVQRNIRILWENTPPECTKDNDVWKFELRNVIADGKIIKTAFILHYWGKKTDQSCGKMTELLDVQRAIEVFTRFENGLKIRLKQAFKLGVRLWNKALGKPLMGVYSGSTVGQGVKEYHCFSLVLLRSLNKNLGLPLSGRPRTCPAKPKQQFISELASLLGGGCVQLGRLSRYAFRELTEDERNAEVKSCLPLNPAANSIATGMPRSLYHSMRAMEGPQCEATSFVTGAYISGVLSEEKGWFATATQYLIRPLNTLPLLVRFCGPGLDEPCGYDSCVVYLPPEHMTKWSGVGRIPLAHMRERKDCPLGGKQVQASKCLELVADY